MTRQNSVVSAPITPIFVVLGLLLLPTAVAEDAAELLRSMSDAMRNESYSGTYVYIHGHSVETLQVSHMRTPDGHYEKLLSLNGEAREIIRNNEQVMCFMPNSQQVAVTRMDTRTAFSDWFNGHIDRVGEWYDLMLLGEDRVAGRDARTIAIVPKDAQRYSHRLWVDRESSLLLRAKVVNVDGQPLEQLMFTSLDVDSDMSLSHFVPSPHYKDYRRMPMGNNDVDTGQFPLDWVFDGLPEGFMTISEQIKPMMNNDYPTHHVILSDGIASVSVYVEPIMTSHMQRKEKLEKSLKGQSNMGALSAFGRSTQQFWVMAVGEVPQETASRIANAVKLK